LKDAKEMGKVLLKQKGKESRKEKTKGKNHRLSEKGKRAALGEEEAGTIGRAQKSVRYVNQNYKN